MLVFLAGLTLVACSPPESFDDTGHDSGPDGGGDTGGDSGGDTGEEAFPAEDLTDVLQTLLAFSLRVSATSVLEPYAELMAGASPGCPTFYEAESGQYWSDVCTSASGTRFDGGGAWIESDGVDVEAGTTDHTVAVVADALIRSPDGAALRLDGQVATLRTVAGDGSFVADASVVDGTFTLDGAAHAWLTTGVRAELVAQGRYEPTTGGRAMYLDGGLFEMDGSYPEVIFYDLLLVDAASGGACPTEPGGSIAIDDAASGQWWEVVFDGETALGSGVADPAKCDGCGEVRFYGQLLGEVCLDFSVLTDWGESPW